MKIDIDKLKREQARSGKTLDDLGFSRSTIQNIRNGHNVLPTTVHKFASALGCTIDDILEGGESDDKANTNESN